MHPRRLRISFTALNRILRCPPSLARQASVMRSRYGNAFQCVPRPGRYAWRGTITPTTVSYVYHVRIVYRLEAVPRVWVLDPPLRGRDGEPSIPHTYTSPDGRRRPCLFHPSEWRTSRLVADTVVPWLAEWLYFYEVWLATGEWWGGGIEHGPSQVKSDGL